LCRAPRDNPSPTAIRLIPLAAPGRPGMSHSFDSPRVEPGVDAG